MKFYNDFKRTLIQPLYSGQSVLKIENQSELEI